MSQDEALMLAQYLVLELGLAIVKRAIDLLAGKIVLKSEVEVGTTFTHL